MKHGSIVWYNDGNHHRRFLFVTFLDDGAKARILDLDSGELIPRVVDAAALTLDDTDNGPDRICAALDKLTAATLARPTKGSDDESAARALASVEKIAANIEKIASRDSDLLAYLKIQQEGQRQMLDLLLSSVRGMADDALTASNAIERRREKTRRRTYEAQAARHEADLVAQAEVDALRRDVANQGKALAGLRDEIRNLHDEIKGHNDDPPEWLSELNKLDEKTGRTSARLSDHENR